MTAIRSPDESLPLPPEALHFDEVVLRFGGIVPGNLERKTVPYYHFRILGGESVPIGHINFRIGDTDHVRLSAGHIGFEILAPHRGRRRAFQACKAIAPFVRSFYEVVTLTCDPDNLASVRTIERLGAEFIDEVRVPPNDPHYLRGSRQKYRYHWTIRD